MSSPQIIDVVANDIEATIKKIPFTPRSLILLLGDFEPKFNPQVAALFRRVLGPISVDKNALIVDDAEQVGSAMLIGEVARDQDRAPFLLGVIPHNCTLDQIDSNHTFILRLPEEWTDTVKYTFQVADHVAGTGTTDPKPVMAILFGGSGENAKKAVLRCASSDRKWPVIPVSGTGGLADEIVKATVSQPNAPQPQIPTDPVLREIIETVQIYPVALDGAVDNLERILLKRIEPNDEHVTGALTEALIRCDELDKAANKEQALFKRIELWLISLAVIAAFFAILKANGTNGAIPLSWKIALHSLLPIPGLSLHIFVIAVPITISIIGAYNNHFRDGYKWVLLRGASEALTREIFKFRVRAGIYSDAQCHQDSRESKLADKLKDLTFALEQSEVNKASIKKTKLEEELKKNPEIGSRLPLLKFLTPDEYLEKRTRDQIGYYIDRTGRLSRKLIRLQLAIYITGGVGTFLAAINLDIWVALATASITALTTKLQADQVETTLVQYNQALTSLRNIEIWWKALTPWEKQRPRNIDLLVGQTEQTLEAETAGWVQQMQSALDKLTEKEPSVKAKTNA